MNFAEVAGGICVVRHAFGASGELFPSFSTVQMILYLYNKAMFSSTARVQ